VLFLFSIFLYFFIYCFICYSLSLYYAIQLSVITSNYQCMSRNMWISEWREHYSIL
jgi:hypothetical protein